MGKFKDLTGQKFGRLTVIERAENDKDGRARWRCKCDCGGESIVSGKNLRRGAIQSCGCQGGKFKDLTARRFGRLTVLEFVEIKGHQSYWRCKCDCGNECTVRGVSLMNGNTCSCGCLKREKLTTRTHGMRHSKIYGVWSGIKSRCLNPNVGAYHNYGGRGIKIYEPWIEDFQTFYDYVSQLPHFNEKGYSLDRIDNSKGYEPGNLRWADAKTQTRNQRTNHFVEYQGKKMILNDAARLSGINRATLWRRIQRGETGEQLFRPPEK